ncbi:MAG: hypothetical protein QF831_00625 [Candidatus Thalassarchaeaceae archaeon]|nr:hypothetical protein [Candidatus Thalassarchaeaceae archaeon]MDP7311920.1 hypothetical protein [Candidatus Thalassarchaeaceae archaeon]
MSERKSMDIEVDRQKSMAHYKKWNQWARQLETHPRGERRPLWMKRPLGPRPEHWFIEKEG